MVEGETILGASNLVTGLLLVLVAIPLIQRRVRMNRWYGVRVPKAFASEANWYAINAFGGRWLAASGVFLAAVGGFVLLAPPTSETGVLLAALAPLPILLLTLVPVMRYAKRLPP